MWGAILQDARRASPDAILSLAKTIFASSPLSRLFWQYVRGARLVPRTFVSCIPIFTISGHLTAGACGKLSISHAHSPLRQPSLSGNL